MIADWVAATVRGRGLAGRRLGKRGARQLAAAPSLVAAVSALAGTPYGREVRIGMDLRTAQHAVYATLLWHLRILAGWARPGGAERVRRLAAGFEIANVVNRFARLNGRSAQPEFTLGALSLAWIRLAGARNPAELRTSLAGSGWHDPQSEDSSAVRIALEAGWAQRVAERVPEARNWAVAYAVLLVARMLAAAVAFAPESTVHRSLRSLLGMRYASASSFAELPQCIPSTGAWVLAGIDGPDDLWRAETRWWARLETEGARLCAAPRPGPGMIVGVTALLAADAWRTCGALELAARGGEPADVFDATA